MSTITVLVGCVLCVGRNGSCCKGALHKIGIFGFPLLYGAQCARTADNTAILIFFLRSAIFGMNNYSSPFSFRQAAAD